MVRDDFAGPTLTENEMQMTNSTDPKIIVALDFEQESQALQLADKLDPKLCRLKVGKEMFTKFGPALVNAIHRRGFQVFLDLKFHDIPNTVAGAVKSAAELGVWMVNVHASGGPKMMTAAKEALLPYGNQAPLLIAVTVLTSMDQLQLEAIGIDVPLEQQVIRLAKLTKQCGLDGVVCSAREVQMLRQAVEGEFCLVTPGIRPAGAALGDQVRVMTPAEAMQAGSSYLVIGRPITGASDPLQALQSIHSEL
ncbi:orotidine-5'-phosphate decarboxylase [Permianibacter aggregans]|uniref:Orotidine 5'-phosphate decarboxylase n=2 Tax=Permianibacter aggregans TaxID=1510150 RepID=A0A4R6UV60_9GAMM|nr:orotidine-5'-phosphate decarboxylase [Permianibacter aggregans]